MAGYTRQSVADIIANAVIKAAPVNAEYNAIRDAFNATTGHKHDGTTAEGAYVPLISDTSNTNKVVIDTANNRISFYNDVSSAAVEQIRLEDGVLKPVTDDDIDLGATGAEFKDLYIDGIGYIDSVVITGGTIDGTTIGGTTAAAGTFTSVTATTADINGGTIDGAVIGGTTAAAGTFTDVTATGTSTLTTVDINGGAIDGTTIGSSSASTGDFTNITASGTLAVTGASTLTGTATITSADINSGAMDNTTIGGSTPAAGTFTNLTASGTTTITTADINGGAIDGTAIGASSASTGAFTTLSATGTSTLSTVDINAGNIDGTVIGASSAAAGSFTTVSTSGQATLATVDINGGAIDNTVIGATTAAAITGTTITGTSFVGPVTGNVTGNLTGNVTGDLTGDVTGNVTASTGSSTFNNVTVNGTLDVTGTTIANVTDPVSAQDAATKNYVDTEIAGLVDSAPGTLDTLNELAAALGDDPDFATTITNSIATKLPLAGGTMTGAIAMGTSKITGLGDPTANQDAATKNYVDSNFLGLSGGTMTGAIDMGSSKITTTYTPTNAADLTTKTYVDGILGSATAAATSATNAATSETNAATSATNAANSATAAATSETNAAASYDSFDDRYLGAKSSAPTVDNDGDALIVGALYFNSTTNIMYVYSSSGWQAAGSSVNGTTERQTYTATSGQTTFSVTYDPGYVDVYLNGVKLLSGTDFTATSGTSIVLTTGATAGDILDIVAYGTFELADHYTKTASDARYAQLSNNLSDLASASTARTNLGVAIGSDVQAYNANLTGINQGLATTDSPSFAGLTVDTNTLYVDSANNRVGVGTASPSYKLDIVAPDNSITAKIANTTGANYIQVTNGTANGYFGTTGANTVSMLSIGTDPITFGVDGGTERMRIDSSGNVGIGTTSPGSETLVVEKSSGTPTIRINAPAGSQAQLKLQADGTITDTQMIHANTDASLGFSRWDGAAYQERFRIGSSGQLGIGGATYGTSGQVLTSGGSGAAPSWTTINTKPTTNVVTTNTTATADNHYYLNAAGITLTLPASPSVGDEVRISEVGGNTDNVIGRNGSNIMGTADDITLDTAYTVLYLRYVDATIGWAFS